MRYLEKSFSFDEKSGYTVNAKLQVIGEDIIVTVYGGEKPHVGAVAVAVPRASLSDPGIISASTSIITMTGHKDDEVVKEMAPEIASRTNRVVVISAGMHWEKVDEQILGIVMNNCKGLSKEIVAYLRNELI